ncbi:hypothetical protein GCM10025787_42670 [Saccharopolyspora rosea]
MRWCQVPAEPGRQDVDPLLADTTDRIVVHGTDADLAAVVLRLLRKNRLADLVVGYVPVADSPASRLWGLRVGDFDRAFDADPRPTPLIRDDSGGLLVASGVIEPATGQIYCDDQQVLNGPALRVEVSPDPGAAPLAEPTADPLSTDIDPAEDGLRVTVVRKGLLRRRREVARGRAAQASLRTTSVLRDGVAHPRPVDRWVWYRHTEDLRFAR